MDYSKKVPSVPNICKVYFDFTGRSLALNPEEPDFNDTVLSNGFIQETYFHKGSIQFSENSSETTAGVKYEQTINISFNSSDKDRIPRIQQLHTVKHIILKLTNGEQLLIGRNDYFQNKKPKTSTTNNHAKTIVEYYTESILPVSNYIGNVITGLPEIIPLVLM
ncbi:MAG TPA: hypothetical protein VKY44_09465 [Flavobacterium sp.]|nr:hypothetical protein [Flavobacterium sp.]